MLATSGGGLRGVDAGMLGVKVRDAELKRSVCSTTAVQTLPKASLQTQEHCLLEKGRTRRRGREGETDGKKQTWEWLRFLAQVRTELRSSG